MKLIFAILLFLVCMQILSAEIIGLTYKQKEILDTYRDGIINESDHKIFWKEFNGKATDKDVEYMKISLNNSLYIEGWRSVYLTLRNAKISYTKNFETEKLRLFKFYQTNNLDIKNLKSAIDEIDMIIYSALYASPIKKDDVEVVLNEEFVLNSIKDYEAIKNRLDILLNPQYILTNKIYTLKHYTLNDNTLYVKDNFKIYINNKYYLIDMMTSDGINGVVYSIVTFKDKIKDENFLLDILNNSYEESFGEKSKNIKKFEMKNAMYGYKATGKRDINDEILYGTIAVIMTSKNVGHIIYVYDNKANDTDSILEKYKEKITLNEIK